MAINFTLIQKLTSPNPFGLITCRKDNGETNLMAISWWTYVSNKPATIAVSISKKSLSNELVRKNKEFALNIVDESIREAAFLCGTRSGRVENKAEKYNIELLDAKVISTQLVKAHKVAMECRVITIIEVADHDIFVAEVVETHLNPEKEHLYAVDGYKSLDTIQYKTHVD
jgi:flavin reductase (DIM6/NTAB) family NADH-FMN oxidoreductase RutF